MTPFGFPPVPEVYIMQAGELLSKFKFLILSFSSKSLLIIESKYFS